MDEKVSAALIAGAVSLAVAIFTTRWQVRSKIDELTQAQLKELLTKRIEVYPQLWLIARTRLSDWEREGKPIDSTWARELLTELMSWHARNGVFLSQASYDSFAELRGAALNLVRRRNAPTLEDLQALDRLNTSGYEKKGAHYDGLATCLKNDLGSYKSLVLTVTSR